MRRIRVRVEQFDENDRFAACLPRTATLTRRQPIQGWGDWYVAELDESFDFEGSRHDRFLLKLRRRGYRWGDRAPTSVFILLVSNAAALGKQLPEPGDFTEVAWGIVHSLEPWWKRLTAVWRIARPG